jgi:hypothetical protein
MRIWFDTEFIEDGKTIDLISIGMVREDGAELYLESSDVAWDKANTWVLQNVVPRLNGPTIRRDAIAKMVQAFAGESPEFWAYYASYDWVVLCQLYGTMMDLPKGWPMYCNDLQQTLDRLPYDLRSAVRLPDPPITEHHALADARWVRDTCLVVDEMLAKVTYERHG